MRLRPLFLLWPQKQTVGFVPFVVILPAGALPQLTDGSFRDHAHCRQMATFSRLLKKGFDGFR
jgi:hypothetical protein